MVKNALLKNLKSERASAQITMKIHRMIKKVRIEKEKDLEKEREKK